LIRLFALFAFLFGLPYLTQGVFQLLAFDSAPHSFFILNTQLAIIFYDFLIGAASIVIGAGLFFHKEWARKAWLAFLLLTLLVHFFMTGIQLFAGYPHSAGLYRWIVIVVFVSIISWVYLAKARIRARFH